MLCKLFDGHQFDLLSPVAAVLVSPVPKPISKPSIGSILTNADVEDAPAPAPPTPPGEPPVDPPLGA